MRVTLPVSPHYKTRGEVATLRWVREHTDIPVPRVIAFEASNDNSIGFEWILMELMPGATAYRRWRTMSLQQKSAITKRVAEFQVQLSCYGVPGSPFKNIGTLDLENGSRGIEAPTGVTPGKLISHEFFMGNRQNYDVPRGPFRSSFDWLSSEIRLIILEQTEALEKAEDYDDREDAEEILGSARRLLSLLPKVFPDDQQDEIATALYHDDLSLHNILVNDDGEITAIVDWECVSAMPIWLTTKMPKFLIGENREEEPIREIYADEIPAESVGPPNDGGPDDLDNEGKNQLYWIHLMEYETTQLRAVYEARLRQLWPAWPLQESQIKVDFFDAVLQCSAGVFVKQADRWVDSIERGDLIRWADA
ncbi:hypothetical protein J7T55_006575 [Diaporthe amygdali]|uniref:uncharacterized protein n=1 Tax=Phomopsis amygdali TaxID=1214568 RepID=UPI0022FE9E8B|nr:uncharacterized protein J7T55_006575 [Diaporthe amygdali]KAJ0125230.1 hypothetical protein J7T55_006575 [Diaporthe amygdali]